MCVTARTFLAALVVLLVSVTAAAVTIHVPDQQPTIQQGIDAASPGDTVLVAPGTYRNSLNRDLDFGGEAITLASSDGAAVTTIDCGNTGRGFFFHSGEDTSSVVRGLTIANAVADSGGGVYCVSGAHPLIRDCVFSYCNGQDKGGGICCDASSPVVRECRFEYNVAGDVGRADGRGAAMSCLSGSSPVVADCVFESNSALYSGGAVYILGASPQFLRCDFIGNTLGAYGTGGAIAMHDGDWTQLYKCNFIGNGTVDCVGGAVHVSSSEMSAFSCRFEDNISGTSGGMHFTGSKSSSVTYCTFVGNIGHWNATGAIHCYSGAWPSVYGCTIVGNSKQQVWCDTASPTIEYSIIAFSPDGLAVYCETGTEAPNVNHCFIYGNAEGDSLCGGNCYENEFSDPCFCDFEAGDVWLCADSPCLPTVTWPSLVGALGQGCPACGSAVERTTWGCIKAMYR